MKTNPPILLGFALCSIAVFMGLVESVQADTWQDTFFQYRIPVTLRSDAIGWHEAPITARDIVTWINATEELKYDPVWFAYNHLTVVALDENARPSAASIEAGFHLVMGEDELLEPGVLRGPEEVKVPVEPGGLYLLRYTASGAGGSPAASFQPTFPVLHRLRPYAYLTSHEPRVLPMGETSREVLIAPNTSQMPLRVRGRFVGAIKEISLRRAAIRFLVKFRRPGPQRLMLYYQPLTGHFLTIPQRRQAVLPSSMASITSVGPAEKYLGQTRHRLAETGAFSAWFAESTVKLTPSSPLPQGATRPIRIAAAANEAQSFQLVLRPKKSFDFRRVVASELRNRDHIISSDRVSAMQIDYVPITEPSFLSPVRYRGPLADPLVHVAPHRVTPLEGNFALWITVDIPPGAPRGVYHGTITIECADGAPVQLPLTVEVFGFDLPTYSPFLSSMGGPHLTKVVRDEKTIADYHRAVTREEIHTLARNYFDVMSKNKFTPLNVGQYSRIGMEWSPPPQGYNVDVPGNFFVLHSWDFTEFNKDLRHYIVDLKVNAFALVHSNPSVITRFIHLPGKPLQKYNRTPSHSSLDWQTWREGTYVGYDKREKDDYIEITKAQFDNLVLQFYHKLAENLEANGWLDYAYILIDETAYRGYEQFLDFIRLLKSDPLTARIKIAWCIQGMAAFNYKSDRDAGAFAFNKLLDIYIPETNENHHFWEKYFFIDYNVEPARNKLWNYVTYTTRVAIDTPGVNNRAIALEVFNNGGGGFLMWASFIWDSKSHQESNHDNPWEQPWTRWGNGAMAYFYPPRKTGVSPELDLTVVPSLRLMTYRESVDDYEYGWMLERLIGRARQRGLDVSDQQRVLDDLKRFFVGPVHWSQNDAWYLELRERMAHSIEQLHSKGVVP